jgi:hypothetical protein
LNTKIHKKKEARIQIHCLANNSGDWRERKTAGVPHMFYVPLIDKQMRESSLGLLISLRPSKYTSGSYILDLRLFFKRTSDR